MINKNILIAIAILLVYGCKKDKVSNNNNNNKNDTSTTSLVNSPNIVWQKCLGGSDWDELFSLKSTSDGGFILVGLTQSNDGDVSGNHAAHFRDIWLVKLNSSGNIEWQKCLGGTGNEIGSSVIQTNDGGFVIAGSTAGSNDGDVSGSHGGYLDMWIVKTNNIGSIEWQKCYGGTGGEAGTSILQTSDGNFIVAGTTYSNDGDVTNSYGGGDFWILKLNNSGSIIWQKCFGGSSNDYNPAVIQTNDGAYMVAGTTFSNDGDVTGNHGSGDLWVIKISGTGSLIWQKCYGGTSEDIAYGESIIQASDGSIRIAGYTRSNDGDVSGNNGEDDAWVIKIDENGILQNQKCFGGSKSEIGETIIQTIDGGFAIAGGAGSIDGDVTGNHGGSDFWIVKLNANDSLEWQKCLGGSNGEWAHSIVQIADSSFIVAGETTSHDGDVTNYHCGSAVGDGWVVKIN